MKSRQIRAALRHLSFTLAQEPATILFDLANTTAASAGSLTHASSIARSSTMADLHMKCLDRYPIQ